MTSRGDFNTSQWEALVEAGPAIAVAVAGSSGSGGDTVRELDAFLDLVAQGHVDADPTSLIGHLIADVHGRLAAGWRPHGAEPYMEGLEAARRAGAILEVSAEPAEATAVRAWLLSAAQRVAEARREGGLRGIGGSSVSVHERETIRAIADALGAGTPEPVEV